MTNLATLSQIETLEPYLPEGLAQAIADLRRTAAAAEEFSDGLSIYVSDALTTTAVAVKAAAGKLYMIATQSLGTECFLSVWNVAQGSVTVGTTSQDAVHPVSSVSGELTVSRLYGNGLADAFDTAITVAVATTARGNSAATNLPKVWLIYA